MAKKEDRVTIVMGCPDCKERNYSTSKNKRNEGNNRLELRKYCPRCRKHTLHREQR